MQPGYGWIFPLPEGRVNVGVGLFYEASAQRASSRVREAWNSFVSTFPLAREIMRSGKALGRLEGAPLRTGLTGSCLRRRGLLVVGEAAGMTYSLSGEGIGKALESGMIAAESVDEHGSRRSDMRETVEHAYERRIRTGLEQRFRAYAHAQAWLSRPWFCNFIAHKATASAAVRSRLEGFLTETTSPDELFSLSGLVRAAWARGRCRGDE